MADTEEKVNKAKKLIHNVIETAASIPEGQNELKRNQLRELAALNGTLRDDENQACQNCGQIGHRKWDCPEQRNFTANIVCRLCGNSGHMARDCPDRQRGTDWRNGPAPGPGGPGARPAAGRIGPGDTVDREYEQLMQELSGGAPSDAAPARIEAGPGDYDAPPADGGDVKPWQRGPTGGPAPWQQRDRGGYNDRAGNDNYGSRDAPPSGGAAPWAKDRATRGNDRGDSYGQDNGYNAPSGGAAPWQQGGAAGQGGQGYGNNYGGYSAPGYASGYPPAPSMGAPPGLPGAPGLAPPPGLSALLAQYSGSSPPPPPPGSAPPPPPPGSAPPPPPSDQPPPPPPPGA